MTLISGGNPVHAPSASLHQQSKLTCSTLNGRNLGIERMFGLKFEPEPAPDLLRNLLRRQRYLPLSLAAFAFASSASLRQEKKIDLFNFERP
jgi:hypothetical protein